MSALLISCAGHGCAMKAECQIHANLGNQEATQAAPWARIERGLAFACDMYSPINPTMEIEPSAEINFRLVEFNQRRALRGAEAARVAVIEEGHEEWLWMSRRDIDLNIKQFGLHPELLKAHLAYKEGGV